MRCHYVLVCLVLGLVALCEARSLTKKDDLISALKRMLARKYPYLQENAKTASKNTAPVVKGLSTMEGNSDPVPIGEPEPGACGIHCGYFMVPDSECKECVCQTGKIKLAGKVIYIDGYPAGAVSIQLSGFLVQTTNDQGEFSLCVKGDETLHFSKAGFVTHSVDLSTTQEFEAYKIIILEIQDKPEVNSDTCSRKENLLLEPDTSISPSPSYNNLLAYYPKPNSEYEVCYMKMGLGGSFTEENVGTSNPEDAYIWSSSYALEAVPTSHNVQYLTLLGSRASCFTGRFTCAEFKKSGLAYDGTTVVYSFTYHKLKLHSGRVLDQGECLSQLNPNVVLDFPEFVQQMVENYVTQENLPRMPSELCSAKYGIYCAMNPDLEAARQAALSHCRAGSDHMYSDTMTPDNWLGMMCV